MPRMDAGLYREDQKVAPPIEKSRLSAPTDSSS